MDIYIWTLWWQGKDAAPPIVKKCFENMRKHSNGVKVVILDKDTVNSYVEIPEHIDKKFHEGKISVTHLSDIIRFQLLYKYGGLWIDSTILVTEDIPDSVYHYDFYTIRGGTGRDCKNVAKGRWTSFLLGGHAGLDVFHRVNCLFSKYWEENDELICYFLIDFCLNEVYNKSVDFRKQIDELPYYKDDVFSLAEQTDNLDDLDKIAKNGPFHKLNWRMEAPKKKNDRVKSLLRHIKELFNYKMMKKWGVGFIWINFLNNIMRSSNSALAIKIADKYNCIVGGGMEEYWDRTIWR